MGSVRGFAFFARARRAHVLRNIMTTAAAALALCYFGSTQAAPLAELKLDYAYYSPESLVIKRNGWLEQEFAADHTQVKWVLSLEATARSSI